MTRFIVAAFTFILFAVVAVPVFADVPSEYDLKTNAGVEKLFTQEQQDSN